MMKYDFISSLVWIVVGLLFFTGSIALGLGSLTDPGPGFFPFLMASCLILFSSIHFLFSLIRAKSSIFSAEERLWPKRDGIRRILVTIILLFLYVFAFDSAGFAVTTLLFMLIILRFVEPQKWSTVVFIGILTTAVSYTIFQLWLKANLPKGLLGF